MKIFTVCKSVTNLGLSESRALFVNLGYFKKPEREYKT